MRIEYTYDDETMTLESLDANINSVVSRIVDALQQDPKNVRVYVVEKGAQYSCSYQDIINLNDKQEFEQVDMSLTQIAVQRKGHQRTINVLNQISLSEVCTQVALAIQEIDHEVRNETR